MLEGVKPLLRLVRSGSRRAVALLLGEWRTWGLYYRARAMLRGPNRRYSIGVVTYVARFQSHFRPFIEQLVSLFGDTPILVAINGHYDADRQTRYLGDIGLLLRRYRNVTALPHVQPQSLSKLWNQLALRAPTSKLLIFNDDLSLAPYFRRELELSPLLEQEVALINASWSHFLVSRCVIQAAGWFDERFPGIGNEDEDYEARVAVLGISVPSIRLYGIQNLMDHPRDFSYGRNMDVVNEKYSAVNRDFFHRKWRVSREPREGYTWVRILRAYVQLREGMETPDFYPGFRWEP